MEIHVVDNNVEKAIRVLKRKLQQEGLFREMKQRKFYEKPSVKRKRKEKEAQRRLRKKMRNTDNEFPRLRRFMELGTATTKSRA